MNFDGPNHLITRDDLVDPAGEEALAAVDADPNSLFRLQQDARLGATIETLTGQKNAKSEGAIGNGVANDAAAFAAMTGVVVVPAGTYRIASSVTVTASLVVTPGATFSVVTGATLTIRGRIIDGVTDMFTDAGGAVNLVGSENEYNLGWFKSGTGYINERWSFAGRAMATFTRKTIRVPSPTAGVAGVYTSGSRSFWGFNGPLLLGDEHNTSTWFIEGEFWCVADCAAWLQIGDAAKPEDIEFNGTVMVQVPAARTVPVGIDLRAVARLTFRGEVVINGADTSIRIGSPDQVGAVGSIRFFHAQCSFYTENAVLIYGKAVHTVQDVQIDRLGVTAAQTTGTAVVKLTGLLRDIRLGNVYYATDVAKDGYTANDADIVVLVESNNQGDIFKVEVGGIFQATADKALVVRTNATTPQTANAIQGVSVEHIWAKYNGVAADIAMCAICYVGKCYGNGDVTIQTSANHITVEAGPGVRTLTNDSTNSVVNNFGRSSQGSGAPPAPAVAWPLGSVIHEPADGRAYLRIAKAGTASDFTGLAASRIGSATLDFPSIPAAGQAELTIPVTGAIPWFDTVALGPPAALEAGLVATARITASGVVTVRLSNITGAAIDPASALWRVTVVR
jgi:hypothetical protein